MSVYPLDPARASALDLQEAAGNRAVTALVAQRAGGGAPLVPLVPLAPFKPPSDFDTMKLEDLNAYADSKPDWSTDPALPKERKRTLIGILEFARNGDPQPLGSCGGMPLADIEAIGLPAPTRAKLRTYARGVKSADSAAIPKSDKLDEALRDGEALGKLEAAIPKPTLHKVMGTTAEGKQQLPEIVAAKETDRFAAYFKRSRAYLEASNGADVQSYLDMVSIDSRHPDEFIGKLPRVHNYHRFLAPMLDTLKKNEGDTSKSKPLTLILHSGSDHNGAFHRDTELMNLVQHPRNLTIMVEGSATLDAMGSEATGIARKFGKKKKIQQLMLAGHGSPQTMDMAGAPDRSGNFPRSQAIDLAKNRARTEKFLKGLIKNMESGPDARIVLNACLTAADEVTANLSNDPAVAKAEILKSLNDSPSLAARLKDLAPGRTVEGNVSSVPAGKYMAEDASGTPTGVMHQIIPSDPHAATSDRAEYVELGEEPEGCMRAAVALWATDKAELVKRIGTRRAKPITGWDDRVIHVLYDIIAASPDNASLMNKIANHIARGLSEFDLVAEQVPPMIYGLNRELSLSEENSIITPLYPHADQGAKLAFDQVWMIKNHARRATFMSGLNGYATTTDAAPHLDMGALTLSMAALLPVGSATKPTEAQMKLALWAVTAGGGDPAATAFLKANAGSSGKLTMPAGTTVPGLTGGSTTENEVLTDLGLLGSSSSSGGTTTEPPNIDLDGDGTPDIFVRSITRTGVVTALALNVRARPELAGALLDVLPGGARLDVIGEVGSWYAVDHRGRVGFVHRTWVRHRAVA